MVQDDAGNGGSVQPVAELRVRHVHDGHATGANDLQRTIGRDVQRGVFGKAEAEPGPRVDQGGGSRAMRPSNVSKCWSISPAWNKPNPRETNAPRSCAAAAKPKSSVSIGSPYEQIIRTPRALAPALEPAISPPRR